MLTTILLQAADAATKQSPWSFWGMIILLIVVFYLFMILPQRRRQKEVEKKRNAMKAGDKVITVGGVHGKIKRVDPEDSTLLIEVAENVIIKIDKSAIGTFAEDLETAKKEDKKDTEDKKDKK